MDTLSSISATPASTSTTPTSICVTASRAGVVALTVVVLTVVLGLPVSGSTISSAPLVVGAAWTSTPSTAVALAPPPTQTPIPRPMPGATPASPPVAPPAAPAAGGNGSGSCGITDLGACVGEAVTGFFQGVVMDALNPLLDLLSVTLLTTPTPDSIPALATLWNRSWQIVLLCYGILILLGGVVVMAHGTLQSRYSFKEIAPRVVVGFLAGALSLGVAQQAVELANALSYAVLGQGLDPHTVGPTLANLVLEQLNISFLQLFVTVFLIGMIVALLFGYVIRVAFTVILIAGAPLFLMWHALPQTEGIAYWWYRATGACLAIQIIQSGALVTALDVFLAPGGFGLFGPTRNGWTNVLVALALIWVLYRIPFWVLAAVRGGGRRSLIGGLIRGYVTYRALGLITGRGAQGGGPRRGGRHGGGESGSGAGGGGPAGGGPASSPGAGPADPYVGQRTGTGGQYALPLPGLRRSPRPRRPTPPAPPAGPPPGGSTPGGSAPGGSGPGGSGPGASTGGSQLALPLGDDWPENRPRARRDGQYRLPFVTPRVTPPRRAPSTTHAAQTTGAPTGPRTGARPATQLELPFDPYRGVRPGRGGQYPLPLDLSGGGTATPARSAPARPVPPARPEATPPRPAGTPRGRQLRLPLDPLPVRTSPQPHPTSTDRTGAEPR